MNPMRFVKIAIATTTLACAGLATGPAVAADSPAWGYHRGYVGGWGWDSSGWSWDSGPYAGYVGTDWRSHGAQPVVSEPYAGLRHVSVGYYPRYVPLGAGVYYSYPGLW